MEEKLSYAQRHVLWDMLNNEPKPTPTNYLIIWFYSDKSYAAAVASGIKRHYALDIRHKTLRALRELEKLEFIQCLFMAGDHSYHSNEKIFWQLTRSGLKKALEISAEFADKKQPIVFQKTHPVAKLNS